MVRVNYINQNKVFFELFNLEKEKIVKEAHELSMLEKVIDIEEQEVFSIPYHEGCVKQVDNLQPKHASRILVSNSFHLFPTEIFNNSRFVPELYIFQKLEKVIDYYTATYESFLKKINEKGGIDLLDIYLEKMHNLKSIIGNSIKIISLYSEFKESIYGISKDREDSFRNLPLSSLEDYPYKISSSFETFNLKIFKDNPDFSTKEDDSHSSSNKDNNPYPSKKSASHYLRYTFTLGQRQYIHDQRMILSNPQIFLAGGLISDLDDSLSKVIIDIPVDPLWNFGCIPFSEYKKMLRRLCYDSKKQGLNLSNKIIFLML